MERSGSPERRLVAEAYRIAIEFWMISRALNVNRRIHPRLHKKLQIAYCGSLDPADDSELSRRARDMQFELWLAAWLTMGDKHIQLREPDLAVAQWFEWKGLAAKRVRSTSKIIEHVAVGAKQVRKHFKVGFIAVSLDNYRFRRNRIAAGASAGTRFFAGFPELDVACEWLKKNAPHVRALIVFAHVLRWRRSARPPVLEAVSMSQIRLLVDPGLDAERLQAFFDEHEATYLRRWGKS